jgi:hypothetical protein
MEPHNKPSEPKNGIWGPKSVWSCDTSIGNFKWTKKKYSFEVKKAIISLQSLKSEFGVQNQFGVPKIGIWGPKSIWSCAENWGLAHLFFKGPQKIKKGVTT